MPEIPAGIKEKAFAGRLEVALDMIVAVRELDRCEACPERSPERLRRSLVEEAILQGSLLLAGRGLQP